MVETLLPLGLGRALLDERVQALEGLVDGFLREPDRDRPLRGDLACDALRLVEPHLLGDDACDES
jgi:hypothetical protein